MEEAQVVVPVAVLAHDVQALRRLDDLEQRVAADGRRPPRFEVRLAAEAPHPRHRAVVLVVRVAVEALVERGLGPRRRGRRGRRRRRRRGRTSAAPSGALAPPRPGARPVPFATRSVARALHRRHKSAVVLYAGTLYAVSRVAVDVENRELSGLNRRDLSLALVSSAAKCARQVSPNSVSWSRVFSPTLTRHANWRGDARPSQEDAQQSKRSALLFN